MNIKDLYGEIRAINDEKGWHDNAVSVASMVANLHGEASELWEAYRAGKLHDECDKADKMRAAGTPVLTCAEEELADIIIRALDDAYLMGVDIEKALAGKIAFNRTRPHRHGGKLA
jgi:NTP pyrophosphatase (non-canonical NTP hydrolase)